MKDQNAQFRSTSPASQQPIDLSPLIHAALDEAYSDGRLPMTRLMEAVAKATNSEGCILWRQRRSKPDEMILLAGWFDSAEPITLCQIKTNGTCAGQAVTTDDQCFEDNHLLQHGNPNATHPFLVRHGINKTFACKVRVPEGDKAADGKGEPAWNGSLCLYRRGKRPDAPIGLVEGEEFDRPKYAPILFAICQIIPSLFRATRHREALRLLQETAKIVSDYHHAPARLDDWEANLKATIGRFGIALQKAFRSLEVSIFLRSLIEPRKYKCWHTTDGAHKALTESQIYTGGLDEGFSGLCLLQDDPIRVADIRHPEDEEAAFRRRYQQRGDFTGHTQKGVSKLVLEGLGLTDEQAPPHSVVYCRLVHGPQVLGFVRCRIVLEGPVLYQQEDGDLLKQAVDSFSQNLAAWWEAHRWEDSVGQVAEYQGRGKSDNQHLIAALELIDSAVPGAEVNTARLPDASGKNLVFVAHSTKAKEVLDPGFSLNTKFPLDHGPGKSSVGADVMRSGKGERFANSDPRYQHQFVGIKELIVVPIIGHDETIYGVLDARTRESFPPYALRLMEIIGRLVGAQHAHLLLAEEDRKKAEAQQRGQIDSYIREIEKEKRHIKAFEDAAHQVKTPMQAAMKLIEIANRYKRPPDMTLIETSLRRADLASKLINTFADIASERPLNLSHSELIPEDLAKRIRILVNDVRRSSDDTRGLRFEFDEDSLLKYAPAVLPADANLLSEAIYNLLENAEKYSHPYNWIRCYGGRSNKGRFFIAVTSRGERIEPHEVQLCKQRRWRKPTLGWKIGSGSGLGLYIVDKIMNAHGGNLNIIATKEDGLTEVRLEFP